MRSLREIIITLVFAALLFALFNFTLDSREVQGQSMLPNIEPGEYILVSKIAYNFHPPERGDIIVLQSPNRSGPDLIKRIIALPGDTIEIKNNKVYVNDTILTEPYISEPPEYEYPRQKIEEDHLFVLGDNRNLSNDSHKGWTVPYEDVVGKAWITYWPPNRWRTLNHYASTSYNQVTEAGKIYLAAK